MPKENIVDNGDNVMYAGSACGSGRMKWTGALQHGKETSVTER